MSLWHGRTKLARKVRLYVGKEKGGVREMPWELRPESDMLKLYPVSHSHMVIHRLIEMG